MLRFAAVALLALISDTSAVKVRTQAPVKPNYKKMMLAHLKTKQEEKPTADQVMEWFDHDKSGAISEEEFMATMSYIAAENNYEPTEEEWEEALGAFKQADTNGDGEIDKAELEAAMAAM